MFKNMFKKVMLVLVSGFLVFAITSCGKNEKQDLKGKIVIRYWNGFTGPDGLTMQSIVDNFNREYSSEDIVVMMDRLPWDTLYQKLLATSVSGTLPDIVSIHGQRIPNLVSRNRLLSIDDEMLEELEFKAEDYIDYAWDVGIYNDNRYSLPLDVHPTAMYYNIDMLEDAGYSNPPTTWEKLEEMAKEMTKNNKYGYVVPSMYSITKDMFLSMHAQLDGKIVEGDNEIIYNDSAGVKAAKYLQDLVHVHKVSPTDVGPGGDGTLFKQGRSAFYFDGP